MELVGVRELMSMKGGIVARGIEAGLERMAGDIAVAKDVEDWRELTIKIRSKPCPNTGSVTTEVVIKPVKLSERVTSFVGDVKQDAGRKHRLVADLEQLGLDPESITEDMRDVG